MEGEIGISAELALVHERLRQRGDARREAAAAFHARAAQRIRCSLWETEQRLQILRAKLGLETNGGPEEFPSQRRAETLLDRHLAKKERLLGIS